MDNFFIRDGFVTYQPTKADIEVMEYRFAKSFSKTNMMNNRTVTDSVFSRKAGILGEIAFQRFYPLAKYVGDTSKEFDFLLGNMFSVDVKCKCRNVLPKPFFEASSYTYQKAHSKNTDMYAFLSTTPSFEFVWFCGRASWSEWWENPKGVLWKKGMKDPSNGKVFVEDTWSVLYKDMGKFTIVE